MSRTTRGTVWILGFGVNSPFKNKLPSFLLIPRVFFLLEVCILVHGAENDLVSRQRGRKDTKLLPSRNRRRCTDCSAEVDTCLKKQKQNNKTFFFFLVFNLFSISKCMKLFCSFCLRVNEYLNGLCNETDARTL